MKNAFAVIVAGAALAAAGAAQTMPADYDAVLKTLGRQGDYKANVLKVNIPRNDLKVSIDGIVCAPPVPASAAPAIITAKTLFISPP